MPLYELFCIAAHVGNHLRIKGLVTTCATHVMDTGGVVRRIHSFGTHVLPQFKIKDKQRYDHGDYWIMHFDANPRAMHALGKQLRKEPLVLRWTMTKLAEKVEDTSAKGPMTVAYQKSVDALEQSSNGQRNNQRRK